VTSRPGLLDGKVAIISGVGGGLGRQIALAFAHEGAAVVLAARTEATIETVAAEARAGGGSALCVQADITEPEGCERLVATAVAELGRVDCLVNNAARGPFVPDAYTALEDADLGAWRRTFDVNVFGTLQLTKAAIAPMKEGGGGSIVFVNTVGVWTAPPRQGAYLASKAALLTAAQVLAKEVGHYNIRVNTVAPGWMLGPPVKGLLEATAERQGTSFQQEHDKIASDIPLGRIPTDAECAGAVVFLASDLAKAMTGQCVDVNGGQVCR
jgi:NAD(P)-dependent dehydrogenase (short-subunit alcohol dehydrogenase family)